MDVPFFAFIRSREISAAYLVGCIASAFGLIQLKAEATFRHELKTRDSKDGLGEVFPLFAARFGRKGQNDGGLVCGKGIAILA